MIPFDAPLFHLTLRHGTRALGVVLDPEAPARLERYARELLRWNAKVNLTAITDVAGVAELHLVDSLALLRVLGGAKTLLDIGSGAGLPGIALACARPGLAVTCCDSVTKKIAFVKAVSALLALDVKAQAVRAGGEPGRERLPRCEAVVSRALADPARWLPLGIRYLAPGGRLFAMLGKADEAALLELAERHGLVLEHLDRFTLPRTGAERALARMRHCEDAASPL